MQFPSLPIVGQGADLLLVRELRFVRRTHRLRTLGLGLGALCVASVLRLHDAAPGWWVLLALHGFVWPHAATLLARRSGAPRRAELRNLMMDSVLGGVWIAVMQFNVLPSVLLVTMLAIDKVNLGGLRLLGRTLGLLVLACAATSAALGFPVDPASPMSVVLACVPFLVIYPIAINVVTQMLASKVARQNRMLEELGRTDGLTGLANRRQCFAVADSELARHFRSGKPVALMILDVDRLKEINDRFGHPVGDEVLCGVAAVLRECCRAYDTPGRYGGDEFMLVLPETDVAGAAEVARRIRQKLDAMVFANARGLKCTVSLGAAEASRDVVNVETWVRQADAALYRAKDAGRDRFVGAVPSA
jgi:diguanylate cyclase